MNNIKRGRLIALFLLATIVIVPYEAFALDYSTEYTQEQLKIMAAQYGLDVATIISVLRGTVVSYSKNGPNQLTITLNTPQAGIVTRSFWVDAAKIDGFINDLEIAKINGTPVELRYHRDWTKTPILVLDDVINL